MIAGPRSRKIYGSASKRFLQSSIERFFENEFPKTFGPVIRQKMAERIVDLAISSFRSRTTCGQDSVFGTPYPLAHDPTARNAGWYRSFLRS